MPAEMEELSKSECFRLLRTTEVGRLATPTDDGGVDIFPVNFIVDHGTIVFRTATGTKLSNLEHSSSVAFEADCTDRREGVAWSVVVRGSAEVIHDRTDVFDSFDLDLHPWHDSHKPFFIRLVPASTTGRRFAVSPSPPEGAE